MITAALCALCFIAGAVFMATFAMGGRMSDIEDREREYLRFAAEPHEQLSETPL